MSEILGANLVGGKPIREIEQAVALPAGAGANRSAPARHFGPTMLEPALSGRMGGDNRQRGTTQ